jgi:hypothetical protein
MGIIINYLWITTVCFARQTPGRGGRVVNARTKSLFRLAILPVTATWLIYNPGEIL